MVGVYGVGGVDRVKKQRVIDAPFLILVLTLPSHREF